MKSTAKSSRKPNWLYAVRQHGAAQRIDLIRQRIPPGNDLQPAGHERDGIDRIAGEE